MAKDLCKSCRFANPDDRAIRIITGRGEIRCRHDKTLIRTSTPMQNIVECVYFSPASEPIDVWDGFPPKEDDNETD
jgi:hypothetical protein